MRPQNIIFGSFRALGHSASRGSRAVYPAWGGTQHRFHNRPGFGRDLVGRLIEETSPKGELIADYIYLGKAPLALLKPNRRKEAVYFYHDDHLGAPRALTDQQKRIVWSGTFDPFGNLVSAHGRITNNLRFPGQYYDRETGLDYSGNRYYDPMIGRYTQPDPIGLMGGLNRYVYVQNNPVNWIDPLGLYARHFYEAGDWTGDATSPADLGQAVWITVQNVNALGTTISILDTLSGEVR